MNNTKSCLRCVVKHLINAKIRLGGLEDCNNSYSNTIKDLNNIILDLTNYILETKNGPR